MASEFHECEEFDLVLEKLFEPEKSPEPAEDKKIPDNKTKYKKIKKLDLNELETVLNSESARDDDINFDEEFQKLVNESRYQKYLPKEKVESPSSSIFREKVKNEYFDSREEYPPRVEEILKVHLHFPSEKELILHKGCAWTNLKILLKTLEGAKGSRRLYDGIQFYRTAVIAKNGFSKFVIRLPEIAGRLKKIISQKCSEVETIIILDEALTTFEKRILREGDYLSCNYRDFERHHLSLALDVFYSSEKNDPLSCEGNIFSPYDLLFFSLEDLAVRKLEGRVVRLKHEWAWYRLSSTDEAGKRHWELDTWLDNFSVSLEPLMCSCVKLFERLYCDRFQDREYRKLEPVSGGIEEDLYTLFSNIQILSNRKRCSICLRKCLEKFCGYVLTENDVVDRLRPDASTLALYESITSDDIDQDWEKICRAIFFEYSPPI